MPELPEVEVVRRGLAPLVTGRRICGLWFSNKRLRLPVPRAAMRRWLVGQRVTATGRRGKSLLLFCDNQAVVVVHLGMTGRLLVSPAAAGRYPHEHCCMALDDGSTVRFVDPRRFGSLRLVPPGEDWRRLFLSLGPEPLASGFSGPVLEARAGRLRRPVKAALMDGRVVAGVGNIYANEILHAAAISPLRPACRLAGSEWEALARHVRQVLLAAIDQGGSTIADFADHSGRPGYFQLSLAVYGRAGEPCRRCRYPIRRAVLAGRTTYFCPACQR